MKPNFTKLMRIGSVLLTFKVLLLLLALSAMYLHGISSAHTLWLGAEVLPVNDTISAKFGVPRKGGALLNRVIEHAPAGNAGLKRGDVLLSIDDQPIFETGDIREVLKKGSFKDSVQVIYLRDGIVYSTKVVLDYRASNASARTVRSTYRYRLTLADLLELLALGLFAGALSGLIGCGGGVLKVSLLIIMFGFEIYLAKVVSLVSCGFMSMSSSYQYLKQGHGDQAAFKFLIPSSLFGVLIGIGVSMLIDRHVLEFVLGLFMAYAALDLAYQIYADSRSRQKVHEASASKTRQADRAGPAPRDRSVLVWAGFPLGIFSAVLGITGGVIGTPLQRFLRNTPLKTCIANTLVTVILVSFLGGGLLLIEGLIRDYFSFHTFILVLLAIMPGSVIGGQLGARLNEVLPVTYVKGVYAAVMLIISYKILTAI